MKRYGPALVALACFAFVVSSFVWVIVAHAWDTDTTTTTTTATTTTTTTTTAPAPVPIPPTSTTTLPSKLTESHSAAPVVAVPAFTG